MRGRMAAGRGLRVTAVVGVLLLGTGAVSAVADDDGAAPVEVVTESPAAEPETEVTEDSTADPDAVAQDDAAVSPAPTADDPADTLPQPVEPTMPQWAVAVMGEPTVIDWRTSFAGTYPDAGTPTLDAVSTPAFGQVTVDLAAGTIEYTSPETKPVTDDTFTVTATGADGLSRDLPFAVVLVWPTDSYLRNQVTAMNTPITFSYVAPERDENGMFPLEPMPSQATHLAAGPGRAAAVVPTLSVLPDGFIAVGAVEPQGSAVLNPDSSITFTPATGFVGVATVGFTVSGAGGQVDGDVQIEVLPALRDGVLDLHTAAGVAVAVEAAEAAGGSGQAFESTWTTAAHGTLDVALPAYGLTYFPQRDYVGQDTFTVQVADAAGQTATVQVTVTVGELPRTGVRPGPVLMAAGAAVLAGLGLVLLRRRVLPLR